MIQSCQNIASNQQHPSLACQTPNMHLHGVAFHQPEIHFNLPQVNPVNHVFPTTGRYCTRCSLTNISHLTYNYRVWLKSECHPHSCSLCTSTWSIKDPSRRLPKYLRPWPWASININLSIRITAPMTMGQHQYRSSRWTIACWQESQSFKIALPQHRKLSTHRVLNSRNIYS